MLVCASFCSRLGVTPTPSCPTFRRPSCLLSRRETCAWRSSCFRMVLGRVQKTRQVSRSWTVAPLGHSPNSQVVYSSICKWLLVGLRFMNHCAPLGTSPLDDGRCCG